jgi:hypothetical protein
VGILRHGGPLLVELLGGCPTPTTRQVSGGDRHFKFYGDRDNLTYRLGSGLRDRAGRSTWDEPGKTLARSAYADVSALGDVTASSKRAVSFSTPSATMVRPREWARSTVVRGPVQVKGKGKMVTDLLLGRNQRSHVGQR